MRTPHVVGWLLATLLVAACSRQGEAPASADAGDIGIPQAVLRKDNVAAAPAGTSLAYERTLTVQIDARLIAARVDKVQAACFAQSIGDCAVLDVQQRGGDWPRATVKMRVSPAGVEKLIDMAAEGGDVTHRATSAEDLADAVADNALRRSRLEKEHARLLEFQGRPNIKLEEMLEISKRLAELEASLDASQQEHAQQRRRIDTNLLTITFEPTGMQEGRSEIGEAFRDFGKLVAVTVATLIRFAAVALPLGVVAWIAWFVVRRWRRRLPVQ